MLSANEKGTRGPLALLSTIRIILAFWPATAALHQSPLPLRQPASAAAQPAAAPPTVPEMDTMKGAAAAAPPRQATTPLRP